MEDHFNPFPNNNEYFHWLTDGTLLKKPGIGELEFYEESANADSSNKYYKENSYLKRKALVPKYLGYQEHKKRLWVQIENIFAGMRKPSYIECKMGRTTCVSTVDVEKKKKDKLRCSRSTSLKMGFRINRHRIYGGKGEIVTQSDKEYFLIKEFDLPHKFEMLLGCDNIGDINLIALDYFIQRLEDINIYFEEYNKRYWRNSSIIFIVSNTENIYDVKMLDFSYVRSLGEIDLERDENYMHGVRSLIRILKNVRDRAVNRVTANGSCQGCQKCFIF